ncbi:dihydroorotase [Bacteroidia bacterium]|nr:dihydroorotase [Bacteroidia bacterium]
MDLLIKNGTVVLADDTRRLDILVKDGVIAKIAPNINEAAAKVIDAAGLTVLPGFVDMHCHLREPGQESKEDITSGARAALHGGFTAVCCMPNTTPVLDCAALVRYVKDRGRESNYAKVYPIGAITKGQKGAELAEIGKMKMAGAVAFSDDGCPVDNGNVMFLALKYASGIDALIISHCEDKNISDGGVVNDGLNATIAGLKGISRAAEEVQVARDIILAETVGTRVHIAHVSTQNSVELIRQAKQRGAQVSCETCPHYFSATDKEVLSYNPNAKINPPLREDADVQAILRGLADGTIDAIATDHAPHSANEKNREFDLAPFGTVGFETAFALAYTKLVQTGILTLPQLSRLMSANPAKLMGIGTGELKEGAAADIAIADLNPTYTVAADRLHSKSKNSLFIGWTLTGLITHTIVDGVERERW